MSHVLHAVDGEVLIYTCTYLTPERPEKPDKYLHVYTPIYLVALDLLSIDRMLEPAH